MIPIPFPAEKPGLSHSQPGSFPPTSYKAQLPNLPYYKPVHSLRNSAVVKLFRDHVKPNIPACSIFSLFLCRPNKHRAPKAQSALFPACPIPTQLSALLLVQDDINSKSEICHFHRQLRAFQATPEITPSPKKPSLPHSQPVPSPPS